MIALMYDQQETPHSQVLRSTNVAADVGRGDEVWSCLAETELALAAGSVRGAHGWDGTAGDVCVVLVWGWQYLMVKRRLELVAKKGKKKNGGSFWKRGSENCLLLSLQQGSQKMLLGTRLGQKPREENESRRQ